MRSQQYSPQARNRTCSGTTVHVKDNAMGIGGLLLEMLLTGFFAVACMRARVMPKPGEQMRLADTFRFTGRIERMRRSRAQWCSIILLLILARVQWAIPMFVEITFAVLLVLFFAVPEGRKVQHKTLARVRI